MVLFGLGAALAAGLLVLMAGGDEQRVFRELGKRVNGATQVSFDAYFECVLAGDEPSRLRNNTELSAVLVARAVEIGPRWVGHLREACLPLLQDAEEPLRILISPAELKADIGSMVAALEVLRTESTAFVVYLESSQNGYEEDVLRNHARRISRPWYEFRAARARANQTIKFKLEK